MNYLSKLFLTTKAVSKYLELLGYLPVGNSVTLVDKIVLFVLQQYLNPIGVLLQ